MHLSQYENFPDEPSQAPAAAQEVGTRAEAAGSSNGVQPPQVPGQRTRLFGSVMDRLRIKSPNDTGALSMCSAPNPFSVQFPLVPLLCTSSSPANGSVAVVDAVVTPLFVRSFVCKPCSAKYSCVVLFWALRRAHLRGACGKCPGAPACHCHTSEMLQTLQRLRMLWLRVCGVN